MCGICGFTWPDRQLVKAMTQVISHRGPDDEGFYVDTPISLGQRRLSIIDVKSGKQPIFNEDRSIVLVYNGEVYNYKALREQLTKHRFYTESDTETLVHAYEEYGFSFVTRLNGMFSFALWDSNTRDVILGVDRLGIKPLYYHVDKKGIIFASEIKALLQHPKIQRVMNRESLIKYLTYRYVPGTETMFKGIHKVPPGHLLVYNTKNKTMRLKQYWNPEPHQNEMWSEDKSEKMVFNLLKDSIQKRLMSEVPFGSYLSGGLDSSIIVSVMRGMMHEPLKTYTVGFEADYPINEAEPARKLAEHWGTEHHELIVKSDACRYLPKTIWHCDELISDPTTIAQYLISEYAKKKITVVLTGEGADELFAGYLQFKVMKMGASYITKIPKPIRVSIPKALSFVPNKVLDKFFHYNSMLGDKGRERLLEYLRTVEKNDVSFIKLRAFFSDSEKTELYRPDLLETEKNVNLLKEITPYFTTRKNLLNQLIYIDMKRRLPNFLLHKIDKMSMAHGIETRVPFLDHELAEASFHIPQHLKLRGTNEKYILKKAFRKYLPDEIIKRKKQDFIVPIGNWFKGDFKDMVSTIVDHPDSALKKYFKPNYITKITENYARSPLYYGRQLWSLTAFDIWHKMYMEHDPTKKMKFSVDALYG